MEEGHVTCRLIPDGDAIFVEISRGGVGHLCSTVYKSLNPVFYEKCFSSAFCFHEGIQKEPAYQVLSGGAFRDTMKFISSHVSVR
ncbi:hypothetical protein F7725_005070 [Dissostichus mawsoni]|uniref:Uncharacterized protein n=1 Tax=Dissostichus mawsoni TaxID=36200 RepID=A0A7J5XKI9_DISMA|nr:hypothetical protein F7725_005070 [Dissostichus mawsoni]